MAANPNFVANARMGFAVVAVANANRDGTGTIVELFAANASTGSKVNEVRMRATGSTTAGMLRFFATVDGGTVWRLVHEQEVAAVTPSGSIAAWSAVWQPPFLDLGPNANHRLGVSTHVAESFHISAFGGDF